MEGSLYLTLSHRRGISQPTKLTKASPDDMRACLAAKEFPSLYQDAITVAKWFGISYIWIDSLCIFQDDGEDFQIEPVKCKSFTLDPYVTLQCLPVSLRAYFLHVTRTLLG